MRRECRMGFDANPYIDALPSVPKSAAEAGRAAAARVLSQQRYVRFKGLAGSVNAPAVEAARERSVSSLAAQVHAAVVEPHKQRLAQIAGRYEAEMQERANLAETTSRAAARRTAGQRASAKASRVIIAELPAVRQAVKAAEDREREALDLARRNYRVALVAAVVALLSLAATVLVAVLA